MEMGGERMPECVTADVLDQTGRAHSFLSGPLQDRFVGMMAAFLARSSVLPSVFLRKDPLPTPVGAATAASRTGERASEKVSATRRDYLADASAS